jgi:hypothetical protein
VIAFDRRKQLRQWQPSGPQALREVARRQAIENPGVPLQHVSGPVEYVPKPVEQVANGAIAIVLGKLVRLKGYVDASGTAVLTDYLITEPTVVAGQLPTLVERVPTPGKSLILTVVGGETIIEGVIIRSESPSFDPIEERTQYLLFLGPSQQPGPTRFETHYGGIFQVLPNKLKPLMKQADRILQGFTADEPAHVFVARMQKAVKAR